MSNPVLLQLKQIQSMTVSSPEDAAFLISFLSPDANEMLQTAAANALISAGAVSVPALLSHFDSSTDDGILNKTSYALSQNPFSPLSFFENSLSHSNPDVRRNCAAGVGVLQQNNPSAIESIEKLERVLYADSDTRVSYEAALSLEKINPGADFWNKILENPNMDDHVLNKIVEISGSAGNETTLGLLKSTKITDERMAQTVQESIRKLTQK
ncbi:hypothetical protein MsAg5_06090 [Methanosarcinaceae archaeon Ag5]|uniref:HEAT repeat domain-containing protein n=1 Tax=Methanolapillus africanus TaxID=3028297 RepID=A0AAE4SEX2_9EURY|nr:hypothetical protein [Methanosarcinaceae archaeon Ag5]